MTTYIKCKVEKKGIKKSKYQKTGEGGMTQRLQYQEKE